MIEEILARLDRPKRTGQGNWRARCPAHGGNNPSAFQVSEGTDGRVVVRCFSGCSFEEIVNAVGLGWEPWFPPKQDGDFKPPMRRPFPAADVLAAVAGDCMLIAVAAANIAHGVQLTDEDRAQVWEANVRIQNAMELALGERH